MEYIVLKLKVAHSEFQHSKKIRMITILLFQSSLLSTSPYKNSSQRRPKKESQLILNKTWRLFSLLKFMKDT